MLASEGLTKLRMFCHTAAKNGYSWDWSDTCCIDRTNSVELQQAILSMFSWYRISALTIVHLGDVPRAATAGALVNSVWFKRGWTLQELLAPRVLLFYTQDWSPYLNHESPNHNEDSVVVSELERIAGICAQSITNFQPGTHEARSRLQWASTRRTTEPEDIAYSLFVIFGIQLPVLYGESAESPRTSSWRGSITARGCLSLGLGRRGVVVPQLFSCKCHVLSIPSAPARRYC
ncbi:hypothetical protein ID866_10930 [Astraeus odoratus]|nr:hypothetical protein ID866_10930 [Astraeus odoratus]